MNMQERKQQIQKTDKKRNNIYIIKVCELEKQNNQIPETIINSFRNQEKS